MNEAPLAGILVVELASVLAGPSVGMFLAEMGAQVVKVEHFKAGGDVTRTWNEGDVVPVTLVFESGTEAVVDVVVTASKGESSGDEHAHH